VTTYRPSFFALALLAGTMAPAWADDSAAAQPVPPPFCVDMPGVTQPRTANSHVPGEYPILSVMTGEQGTTVLKFTIKDDGTVGSAVVLKSSGSMRLDDAAVQSVTGTWRYTPALSRDGKPFACSWKAEVKWVLHGSDETVPAGLVKLALTMKAEDYPPDALKRGEHGTVGLVVLLVDGEKHVIVLKSSGFADLDSATIRIVQDRLKLTAAEFDGRPVATSAILLVVWQPPAQKQ